MEPLYEAGPNSEVENAAADVPASHADKGWELFDRGIDERNAGDYVRARIYFEKLAGLDGCSLLAKWGMTSVSAVESMPRVSDAVRPFLIELSLSDDLCAKEQERLIVEDAILLYRTAIDNMRNRLDTMNPFETASYVLGPEDIISLLAGDVLYPMERDLVPLTQGDPALQAKVYEGVIAGCDLALRYPSSFDQVSKAKTQLALGRLPLVLSFDDEMAFEEIKSRAAENLKRVAPEHVAQKEQKASEEKEERKKKRGFKILVASGIVFLFLFPPLGIVLLGIAIYKRGKGAE